MPDAKIIIGDCRQELAKLPERSVHCIITSPPYWNLRDYTKDESLKQFEIGCEETHFEYVENLNKVFIECLRVLRDDGTLWLNLGDTTQDKHLLLLPFRLAFAMEREGWILRAQIPWIKRNPKPESIKDRPANALETIMLFAKSRYYYYDSEANRLPGSMASIERRMRGISDNHKHSKPVVPGRHMDNMNRARPNLNGEKKRGHRRPDEGSLDTTTKEEQCAGTRLRRNTDWFWESFQGMIDDDEGNPLAIAVNPIGYKGQHTATFPERLIKPMIEASTPQGGCCPTCFTPFERIVKIGQQDLEHQQACGGNKDGEYHGKATKDFNAAKAEDASALKARILDGLRHRETVGWKPTCSCVQAGAVAPATILDPFGGSGTVGEAALKLGRRAILIELEPKNMKLINERTHLTPSFTM